MHEVKILEEHIASLCVFIQTIVNSLFYLGILNFLEISELSRFYIRIFTGRTVECVLLILLF